MATIELTKDNFENTVNDNPIVIIDFWAPWCGPCKGFAPVFEKASESHPDVVFAKVNSDEQQELAGAFNIRSIPTLMVFREKVVLFQQAGALPGQALEQVLAQDRVGRARQDPGLVEVFHPQQPASAGAAAVEPARQRGDQRTEMQRAGGRGRETTDVRHAD